MIFFIKLKYYYFKFVLKSRGIGLLDSTLGFDSKIESGSLFISSSLGNYSYCGYDCNIVNTDIGSFCSLSNRIVIGGASHPMHFVSTSPAFLSHKDSIKTKFSKHEYLPQVRTTIGNDVWIGENVMIKAGVKVGNGAVIGMGSVVTRNVPDYAVIAGNPARIIRYRFDDKTIAELLSSRWWRFSIDELYKNAIYFDSPSLFLKKIKGKKCV